MTNNSQTVPQGSLSEASSLKHFLLTYRINSTTEADIVLASTIEEALQIGKEHAAREAVACGAARTVVGEEYSLSPCPVHVSLMEVGTSSEKGVMPKTTGHWGQYINKNDSAWAKAFASHEKPGQSVRDAARSLGAKELSALVPVSFASAADANDFEEILLNAGVTASCIQEDAIGNWRIFVLPQELEIAHSQIYMVSKRNILQGGI